jgi:hypothetical protein
MCGGPNIYTRKKKFLLSFIKLAEDEEEEVAEKIARTLFKKIMLEMLIPSRVFSIENMFLIKVKTGCLCLCLLSGTFSSGEFMKFVEKRVVEGSRANPFRNFQHFSVNLCL